jgi:serine/threonine protein kinase/predicted Zn-dependent protease
MKGYGDARSGRSRLESDAQEKPDSSGSDSSADSLELAPEVLQILENYMAELENGRQPNVEELIAQHPELEELGDLLQGCLTSLEFLHPKDPQPASDSQIELVNGAEDLPPPNPALGQLGDFGLVREIGRGGMGIVYEAVQISLHRRVALKVLPFAAALDAKQLQRFKNEALAAAGLHHPHIVPIHAVGSERGVHYYAMQLIEGKSLADAIIELRAQKSSKENRGYPIEDRGSKTENRGSEKTTAISTFDDQVGANDTPPDARRSSIIDPQSSSIHPRSSVLLPASSLYRQVAQLGIQAADALGHAHRLGIIHRDIKPANLILDDDGKLWVTDFGLALVQSNMELTASGDMLGTLRYMSPEQASAKRGLIDQRTDIYSLGATLYELLTLQPAFPEKDRHQLLAQIATEEPRPPRRLNPAIPKDLETIVLKSMAKSPPDRYTTAEELAEDLKRFLDDRPIQATRPSVAERALKWCRRHKALVASSTLLALGGVILAAVLFYDGKRRDYEAEIEKQNRELQEQRRILDNLDTFYVAFHELFVQPALDRIKKSREPKQQREDRELLRKLVAHFQRIANLNSAVPLTWHTTAVLWLNLGDISQALGETAEAKDAYKKAIDLLEALAAENPREPKYRGHLAQGRNKLGSLYWTNSDLELAEQTLGLETRDLERAVQDFAGLPDFRNELANSHINLGMLLLVTGQSQRAEEILHQNEQVLEELTTTFPCQPIYQKTLSDNHGRLGWVFRDTGRLKEAEESYTKARLILDRLHTSQPKEAEYTAVLANVTYNLGILYRELDRLPDSESAYQSSIALSKSLVTDFPRMPDYELELANEKHQLGLTLYKMKRFGEAEDDYRQAKEILERLVHDFPAKQKYQEELAYCSNNFALLLENTGKAPEAEEAYTHAASLLEDLAKRFPAYLDYQSDLGSAWYSQARLLANRHENEKACQLLRQAIDHQIVAVQYNPRNPHYAAPLWPEYQLLLQLLLRDHKLEDAKAVLQQAPEKCKNLPLILNNLAWFMVCQPQPPAGDLELGLRLAKQATEKLPKNGGLWNTLGVAHYRVGNWQDAIDAIQKSLDLRKGGDSYDFFFLAMAHWQLGAKEQAQDWYKKAMAAMPKNKNQELGRIQEEAAKLLNR